MTHLRGTTNVLTDVCKKKSRFIFSFSRKPNRSGCTQMLCTDLEEFTKKKRIKCAAFFRCSNILFVKLLGYFYSYSTAGKKKCT